VASSAYSSSSPFVAWVFFLFASAYPRCILVSFHWMLGFFHALPSFGKNFFLWFSALSLNSHRRRCFPSRVPTHAFLVLFLCLPLFFSSSFTSGHIRKSRFLVSCNISLSYASACMHACYCSCCLQLFFTCVS
jgi:hypothetical protein